MAKLATTTVRRRAGQFDSLHQEVFLGLWRTYDRLKAFEDELFETHDLTAQQYNLLRLLAHVDPEPMATLDLASRLVSRAPDITRMLDKLEQRELVQRVRQTTDRRIVRVGISEAGKDLIAELRRPLRECHDHQLGHLSRPELKALGALLRAAREIHEPPDSPWR